MTTASARGFRMYEGSGDEMVEQVDRGNRIVLLPDAHPSQRDAAGVEYVRIMWGQRLIDDLLAGRYRALICAVNASDNSHGIISLLARQLPTSQWNDQAITEYARHFVQPNATTVVKYDMDRVTVLALLRPSNRETLTLNDLADGFGKVSAMLHQRPERFPAAAVSFLGARANRLVDKQGQEPSFEKVLHTMHDAGFRGDVFPAPALWQASPAGVFPRYPFPESFKQMCDGGF